MTTTTPATTPADGLDLPKRLEEWANGPMFLSDTPAVKAVLRIAADRIRELERATPSPGKAPEPVAWHIGNADGTINSIGAVYIRRSLAEKHIASYDDGEIDAAIVPLYASPGKAEAERWIPVSERLPEDDEPVIVMARNKANGISCCLIASFDGEWKTDESGYFHWDEATHWQPLPPPPA